MCDSPGTGIIRAAALAGKEYGRLGISAHQLHPDLDVRTKYAWFDGALFGLKPGVKHRFLFTHQDMTSGPFRMVAHFESEEGYCEILSYILPLHQPYHLTPEMWAALRHAGIAYEPMYPDGWKAAITRKEDI